MSNNTIQPNMLKADVTVLVRGNIVFSKVTKHITGEELEKDRQRRQRMGMNPIDKPYITVTVNNARVLPKGQTLTTEEQYIQEHFYTRATDNSNHYSINSKSPYLPWFGQTDQKNPKKVDQVKPTGEPAVGLDVTLVLRTFQAGIYANKGWNLDGVIANEPIRYYSNADARSRMAEAGITFNPLPADNLPTTDLEAPSAPMDQAPLSPADAAESFAEATPVTPPVGNPYASSDQNFGMNIPVTPVADNGPWVCPNCGQSGNTGKFCQNCATPKPMATQPVTNPYAAPEVQNASHQGGIMFDPNEIDRNY